MKKSYLGELKPELKTGDEQFNRDGDCTGLEITLKEFWRWLASDLVINTTRGCLAEFIVARALGAKESVRNGWAAYDIETSEGIKVEIKSGAYLQSWPQDKLSSIQFNVEPTKALDPETGLYLGEAKRWADVYVFALLSETDKTKVDFSILNINQWKFYILPTAVLDNRERSQHSITLKSLEETKETRTADYSKLRKTVLEAYQNQKAMSR